MKRTRVGHRDHAQVQHYHSKFSKLGSGRPVKRMNGELAQRDRQKQVISIEYIFIIILFFSRLH